MLWQDIGAAAGNMVIVYPYARRREMTSRFLILGGVVAFASVLAVSVAACGGQDSAMDSATLFQSTVGPLIRQRCASCHNGKDRSGGLDLSDEAAARKGGTHG